MDKLYRVGGLLQRQTGSFRAFATSTGGGGPGGKDDASAAQPDGGESTPQPQSWISRILTGPQANPAGLQSQSHSSLLAVSDCIYELQTHDAAAGKREEYLQTFGKFVGEAKNATPGLELVGSWTVMYGNQDQLIHLWRYNNGWADVDNFIRARTDNSALRKSENEVSGQSRRRRTVLVKPFSYWGEVRPREASHIYDLRSYVLKPGSMIEWGNAWARGITYRRDFNQDVGGFFAQVGQLYMVFHIWAYKSMQDRNKTRQHTWSKPGWDSTVALTVPLIKKMQSKVLIPNNDLSQLK
ncbi:Protein K02D10.1 b [Aphelenchoides avenae]|nr:Protein K02D10.1 b [Aphelenchus avenae]